jgi:hypothetical protein
MNRLKVVECARFAIFLKGLSLQRPAVACLNE